VLGIQVDESINHRLVSATRTEGVFVLRVQSSSEADKAGLKGISLKSNGEVVPGDVIVAINGNRMTGADRLLSYLDEQRVGDQVTLTVRRENTTKELKLKLQAEQ
jgi:S1-C subfamily serine protease